MAILPSGWAASLKPHGFRRKGNTLIRVAGINEQSVFAKKNLHDRTYQVWATVGIHDRYDNAALEYVFVGYVCPDRISFFATDESWWSEGKLETAVDAVREFALPWLDQNRSSIQVLSTVERCLERDQSWNYYLEGKTADVRAQRQLLKISSLLNEDVGNLELSRIRAQAWFAVVKDQRIGNEPGRTLLQLDSLSSQH
jgi:hypothetical protein